MQIFTECFSGKNGKLKTLKDAQELIKKNLSPIVSKKRVSIYEAAGYVLAKDINATVNIPAYDNSAVDGYAVLLSALDKDASSVLKAVGRVTAGDKKSTYDTQGAVRIFTGAPIPIGFNAVCMQEDIRVQGEYIVIPNGLKVGDNIRYHGEDVKSNTCILSSGKKLLPADIALIASQGIREVEVYEKLKVGFFSSGNELLEVGSDKHRLEQGYVFDSNRPMLLSILQSMGVKTLDLGSVRDVLQDVQNVLRTASTKCDVILSSGGMSVGEEDHVRTAFECHRVNFWKLAIKPGKPVGFGFIHNTPFLGFPGNPVSVYVVFALLGTVVIKALGGQKNLEIPRISITLGFPIKKKTGRREFLRVFVQEKNGIFVAMKAGPQGSGIISSIVNATGLIEIDEDTSIVNIGDTVTYIPFKGVFD